MPDHIFLSVSDKDRQVAEKLCRILERHGLECWLASRDISPGADWSASIIEALRTAKLLLLVLTRNANVSSHVKREVERAVNRGIPLVAFRLEEIEPSPSLEYFLSTTQQFDAFASTLTESAERLANHLGGSEQPRPRGAGKGEAAPDEASLADVGYVKLLQDPQAIAGLRVDGYRLGRRLGVGGQGHVFEAVDSRAQEPVCIKIMHLPQETRRPVHDTVFSCARSLAALNHPAIVPIVGFGAATFRDATTYYIAMRRIDGDPLDRWAASVGRDGRGFDSLLRAALRLADALRAAHRTEFFDVSGKKRVGIYHGDVKPGNIMVAGGEAFISDFMMLDPREVFDVNAMPDLDVLGGGITSFNGTPGYMAPEQQESGELSARADIHCFGRTLGEIFFAAHAGFEGVDADDIDALRVLVDEMTAEQPEQRPESVADVVARLRCIAGKNR